MKNVVILAFGSNIGNRISYILNSISQLIISNEYKIIKLSKFYETKPLGGADQENYINCVASFETRKDLHQVFNFTKELEKKLGRKVSEEKWQPREIDIDILFFNDTIIEDENLIVPHKELLKRDFVMEPLKEVAGDFIHPKTKQLIKDIDISSLEKCIVKQFTTDFKNFAGEVIGRY